MNLRAFALLTDENIQSEVCAYLRAQGCDIVTVNDRNLQGRGDDSVLAAAYSESRLVLTHDSDFGALALAGGEPILGIIYLRPGHLQPEFTIATLRTLFEISLDLTPPFLLVAVRRENSVRVRIRPLRPIS